MIRVNKEVSLQSFNTLNLPSVASHFIELTDEADINAVVDYASVHSLPILWIGGGSNLVLSDRIAALVVHISLRGIRLIHESKQRVLVDVMAGENWHHFVNESVLKGWFGIENLALIPGTVGAAPVQNIGAYGVEAAEFIDSVRCYDVASREMVELSQQACGFAYRDSIFKRNPGRYLIISVRFSLNTQFMARLGYVALDEHLHSLGIDKPSANDLLNAVVAVRQSKLPDPSDLPNAGSFFKNPVVDQHVFESLKKQYPSLPYYKDLKGYKLAAGWLIDQCGWKGKRLERVGVHAKQALVLVNHSEGDRNDIDELSNKIKHDVKVNFGIDLEQEPIAYP